jgi:hypothetical protein
MVNALFGQTTHDDIGAIEFHMKYSFRNRYWYPDWHTA